MDYQQILFVLAMIFITVIVVVALWVIFLVFPRKCCACGTHWAFMTVCVDSSTVYTSKGFKITDKYLYSMKCLGCKSETKRRLLFKTKRYI